MAEINAEPGNEFIQFNNGKMLNVGQEFAVVEVANVADFFIGFLLLGKSEAAGNNDKYDTCDLAH